MATDDKYSPDRADREKTTSKSPDDTSPPDVEATIIDPSLSVPATDDEDQTIVTSDAGTDSVHTPDSPPDIDKTMMMDPSLEESGGSSDGDDPTMNLFSTSGNSAGASADEATFVTRGESSSDDAATIERPAEQEGSQEFDATAATHVGDRNADLGDSDRTRDEGATSSDPYDQTVLQDSDAGGGDGAGTASGTAAKYIPPQSESGQSKDKKEYPNLGRFEIQGLLGQGAFGAVYLAHDPHLDRKVAIKVAKTGVLVGKQDVDRFMREARSAAQLRHPNIVPVYEVGNLTNTNFIAYEYVEGRTLGDLMKEKKTLSPEVAATYMKKIAAGLHYAHEHGIIHRDMKPDNVLLDVHNEPHIADFGLARRDESDTVRTREGMFMGTPSYMSPEQASGKAHLADARSDVWSLGVMLQEMLTGMRPFRGNVTEVLVAVQNQEPTALRTIDKSIPADLETIVEKCLTKNLNERYQSAQMLSEELERWLRGEPILARPLSVFGRTWRWMKRRPDIASLLGVIALVLVVASGVSLAFGISARRSQQRAHDQALARAAAQLTSVRTADAASLPVLIDSLAPHGDELRDQLLALVDDDDLTDAQQSRVRLAATMLYPKSADHGAHLKQAADDLLMVSPPELVVRVGMLTPFREQVEVPLWNAAQDNILPQRRRFQALAALASLKSTLPDWSDQAADMVAEMLTMNPLELSSWLPAVAPIRDELQSPLTAAFTTGTDPNAQYRAAIVLGELFIDTPETLIALVPQAQPNQLPPLIDALQPRADFFAERLTQQLTRTLATDGDNLPTDEQATKAVNIALALLGLGGGEDVWPLLRSSPNQHLRTSLIHSMASAGLSWKEVTTRLEWEQDPGIIAALCLALGEFGEGDLLPSDREQLAPGLLEQFKTHENPGVHAAVEWLLRKWGRADDVEDAIASLKSTDRDTEKLWHIDGPGHTFAVVPPTTFAMGSPDDEPARFAEEVLHERLVPRTFGIATREVTVADYMEFDPDFKINQVRRYIPDDDCPIVNVTWFDAIAYCRWLSEKEGFEEQHMCYPSLDELKKVRDSFGSVPLKLPDDLLDRPGYRLPTAGEWELAARAGTVTARPFGNPPTYAPQYAWYRENGQDRTWPTGLLKPNDNGLFDIQGNALEWTQSYFFDTPPPAGADNIVIDGIDTRDGFNREGRGGSNRYPIDSLRVAYRDPLPPGNIDTDVGFRLARTYVAPQP